MQIERAIMSLTESFPQALNEKVGNTFDNSTYLAALQCLISDREWLNYTPKVDRVLLSLDHWAASKNPDVCRQITKLYQHIIAGRDVKNAEIAKVKVKISNDIVAEIPKQLLLLEGCKFEDQIDQGGVLDLSGSADAKTLLCFVEYLRTGSTHVITDKNAVAMFQLASSYGVHDLSMKSLRHIFSSATGPKIQEYQPPSQQHLSNILRNLYTYQATIDLVNDAYHVRIKNSSRGEVFSLLTELNMYVPITHLSIGDNTNLQALLDYTKSNQGIVSLEFGHSPDVGDGYLEALSENLPNIKQLSIKNARITRVPDIMSNRLERIYCLDCKSLNTLKVPVAKNVDCQGCSALSLLKAPQVERIDCMGCTELKTLKAPLAKSVLTWGCAALETLETGEKLVECSNLKCLKSLRAPQAEKVDCYDCIALMILDVPQAKQVTCRNSVALETLKAPLATTVDCFGCKALVTLEVPLATKINCSYCNNLKTLKAPLATEVNCRSCIALETLELPLTIRINCSICLNLATLTAPLATEVDCNGCSVLATLEVPLATKINCSVCCNLETLTALLATEVDCYFCTKLVTLEVPLATKINCSECYALQTLKAPLATEVNREYCRELKTLETGERSINCPDNKSLRSIKASLATEVKCRGCTVLETLEAPMAKKVDCRACSVLKIIQAPLATEVRYHGCVALDTWNLGEPASKQLLLERRFKADLQQGRKVNSYIAPLMEMLADANTSESVPGELGCYAEWAQEAGHKRLSSFLTHIKDEISRSIVEFHTKLLRRTLLREAYQLEREKQNLAFEQKMKNDVRSREPELNIALFLENEWLLRSLRSFYNNIKPEGGATLKNKVKKALKAGLQNECYPNDQNADRRRDAILSFFDRIPTTKDYTIDPKGLNKRMTAIADAICSHTGRTGNTVPVKAILQALNDGAEMCVNRSVDAMKRVEIVIFQEVFKGNSKGLYGIALMEWKRAFVEEYVLKETLKKLFDAGCGRAYDVEVVMANFVAYDEYLGLNIGIQTIEYLYFLRRELEKTGKSGQEVALPDKLFNALMERVQKVGIVGICLDSPLIQQHHGLESAEEVIRDALRYYRLWVEDPSLGDANAPFPSELTAMQQRYDNVEGSKELRKTIEEKEKELRSLLQRRFADDGAEYLMVQTLSYSYGELHQRYIESSLPKLKERIVMDLVEAGYLIKPESQGKPPVLDYPTPKAYSKNPNVVAEVCLLLNMAEMPEELRPDDALL